jgi:hypothetical protein
MDNKAKDTIYGRELAGWDVDEHNYYDRSQRWYMIAIGLGILMIIYSFFTGNFLFAVIIILAALVMVLRHGQEPDKVRFSITDEGIVIGKRYYDYDEIKNFSIVYKPRLEVKNLYFEFKNVLKHRLSISLENMNPLPIRDILLKYISEDLERTDQPLSEFLGKFFKL